MSPETERNINNFVNSWNYTGALMKFLLVVAIGLPIALAFLAVTVLPFVGMIFDCLSDGWEGVPHAIIFLALLLLTLSLLVAPFYCDDVSIFETFRKKEREEDSSALPSEEENRKRAEHLWKL